MEATSVATVVMAFDQNKLIIQSMGQALSSVEIWIQSLQPVLGLIRNGSILPKW